MKTVFLPLDSRPVCFDLPILLNEDLVHPPLEMLDDYRKASSYDSVSSFLEEECRDADALILSAEQLVYGGLIASRNLDVSEGEALDRLSLIRKIKHCNPGIRIMISSVIMRDTVSALSQDGEKWWSLISLYSKAAYWEDRDQLDRLEKIIPRDIISAYLAARKRNSAINLALVDQLKEGVVNLVVFLQEDTQGESLPAAEQEQIKKEARGLNFFMHNGTDECASELAARLQPAKTVSLCYLNGDRNMKMRYEDRPFAENLESHLRLCGLTAESDSDDILFIHLPKKYQFDHKPHIYSPEDDYSPQELDSFADEIKAGVEEGRNCYILDAAWANGADVRFMDAVSSKISLSGLSGYSAWNTASNSIGTICAQIKAGKRDGKLLKRSILDDLVYQALIRDEFESKLTNKWNIEDRSSAERILRALFQERAARIMSYLGEVEFDVSLRWSRTFEIDVEIRA